MSPAGGDRVFPPDSQIWRLARENVLLLGGPAAAILQIAHPEVAAGVAAHSQFQADALGRLRRTLDAVHTITFGSRSEAEAMRKRIAAVHGRVRGTEPVAYNAFSPDAQMWVLATLIAVGTGIFESLVAPLTPGERESHYRDMRAFGEWFGLSTDYGPQTAAEFADYYREMLEGPKLAALPICRELARAVVAPRQPRFLNWVSPVSVGVVAETLPLPIRERLGFRSTAVSRSLCRGAFAVIRGSLPIWPAAVRFVPAYRRAVGMG